MSVYLDNAATSFPKPESVYAAMDAYSRTVGAPAGRGAYQATVGIGATVQRCRKRVSDLLGVGSVNHVVMTFNCTDGLNTVFHGLLKPGDHVVTSQIEHNSVLRPLAALKSQGVESTLVPVDSTHRIEPAAIRAAIRPGTKLVAVLHASNVTGVVQPIIDIGEVARERGVMMLVDAAQTAGQFPINMQDQPVDFLVSAGHKSLLGPLGTGILCIRPGLEGHVASFRQGGTGSSSESPNQPEQLPERFESGSPNVPGLVGLEAGVEHVANVGPREVMLRKQATMERLLDGLARVPGLTIHHCGAERRVSVLSLSIDAIDPQDVATILDQNFGIQCRAGLHCAPGAHAALGTLETGGTVRLSPGLFTSTDEIDQAIHAITEVATSL